MNRSRKLRSYVGRPGNYILLWLILFLAGCSTAERIPHYPSMPASEARAIIAARDAKLETVSSPGTLELTDAKGRSIQLDAAVALALPERARIRAWKFGQAVFDLTILPDGLWLYSPRDEKGSMNQTSGATGNLVQTWLATFKGFFADASLEMQEEAKFWVMSKPMGDGTTLRCRVDRTTLTPRLYTLYDDAGSERFSLALDRYVQAGELLCPGRIRATRAGGTILIKLRDVEINAPLPASAFKPPTRARKLP